MTLIIIRLFAAVIAAVLLNALLRGINVNRLFRIKQTPLIVGAPAAMLVELLAAGMVYRETVLAFTADSGSLLQGADVLIWNILVLLLWLPVKGILCLISGMVFRRKQQSSETEGLFYEYDRDQSVWFLKTRLENLQNAFSIMSWAVCLITGILLGLGWAVQGEKLNLNYAFFPMAAMVVVTEFANVLGGYTRTGYHHNVEGEDSISSRIRTLYKLKEVYEALFPANILAVKHENQYPKKSGASNYIDRLCESSDPRERLAGKYFRGQASLNSNLDVDLMNVCVKLLHRENVVVLDPFYKDLGRYIMLPLVNSLLGSNRCLVITGRQETGDDVIEWMKDLFCQYTKSRSLWRAARLGCRKPDCEVGVLGFADLYDADLLSINAEFIQEADVVIVLEPSRMLTTAQMGLRIVAEQLHRGEEPVFLIADREEDGLVDTLSHVLQTNLTNVVSLTNDAAASTAIGWSASGDYQAQRLLGPHSHFLGNGIAIASVALRNQVDHLSWYGADKAPVRDISWLARQYYPLIRAYANLPGEQSRLEESLAIDSNLWGAERQKDSFVIVEDEFCHMFSMIRVFLTRGTQQSFVNVISENYLLRDYMRYNAELFMNEPRAVSAIAPAYAQTERNMIMKLILTMAAGPVREEYLTHELEMIGGHEGDIHKQLNDLITRYTGITQDIVSEYSERVVEDYLAPVTVTMYRISSGTFRELFSDSLKIANFVVEDENTVSEKIDAKMFEHIAQIAMPGQYMCYDGKYYCVRTVNPLLGCVLHRASDAYTRRMYYRQLRTYSFGEEHQAVTSRKVGDLEITLERRNFAVDCRGYLEMRDNDDLRSARRVDLTNNEDIHYYHRTYRNKQVLGIRLPDTTKDIRFTIAVLLSEMMRTIFPEGYPYLAILTESPDHVEGMLCDLTYRLEGQFDEEIIYIVEDSSMDLGLIEAFDRNLNRIFEILTDFLLWHFEKVHEAPMKDPVVENYTLPDPLKEERESRLKRFLRQLASLFHRSKDTPGAAEDEKPEPSGEEPENGTAGEQKPKAGIRTGAEAADRTKAGASAEPENGKPDESEDGELSAGEAGSEPEAAEEPEAAGESAAEEEPEAAGEPAAEEAPETAGESAAEEESGAAVESGAAKAPESPDREDEASGDNRLPKSGENEKPGDNDKPDYSSAGAGDFSDNGKLFSVSAPPSVIGTEDESDSGSGTDAEADGGAGDDMVWEDITDDDDPDAAEAAAGDESRVSGEIGQTENEPGRKDPVPPAAGEGPEEAGTAEAQETPKEEKEVLPIEPEFEPESTVEESDVIDPRIPESEQIVVIDEGDSLRGIDDFGDDLDLQMDRVCPIIQTRYRRECYLKFGFDAVDEHIAVESVRDYLVSRGWGNNALTKARTTKTINFGTVDLTNGNCCDFCGMPLTGISYEHLSDGRVRCNECSKTAITEVKEFERIYNFTKSYMEQIYDISINVSVEVRTTDARTIAKATRSQYVPSDTGFTPRVLGFAQKRRDGSYYLFVENGSPRLAAILTIAHELTHIWQYRNWKDRDIKNIYGKNALIVYEGMAMWSSIQLLFVLGENVFANREAQNAIQREDVYGQGFRAFLARYPFAYDGEFPSSTPFRTFPPVD